jgi:transcriptional regulator with XRE-family HTH domain
MDVLQIGQRLAALRSLSGLSLRAAAARSGVARSYLSRLERGEIANPGIVTLAAVVIALGSTLNALLPTALNAARPARMPQPRMPPTLRRVLAELADHGEDIPTDVIEILLAVRWHGRQPKGRDDWLFLYEAIKRSVL